MERMLYGLIFAILLIAGIILLQIFLSKRERKMLGLVLPAISFLIGLLFPLNMMVPSGGITAGFIFEMLFVWLLGNIPTFVFLAIYFSFRGKQR